MEDDKPQLEMLGEMTKNFPLKIDYLTQQNKMHPSIKDDDKIILINENGKWIVYKIL